MGFLSALDELEAAWDTLASLPVEGLSALQVLAVLDRLERHRRRLPGFEHALVSRVQAQAGPLQEASAEPR